MKCITMDTNVLSGATGQYRKFNFSSMAKFGTQMLGVNDTGLYILGGPSDDDGAHIEAFLKTGMTDLGYLGSKRLRKVYIGLETTGDLQLQLFADEKLVLTKDITAHKIKQQRISISIGSRSGKKGAYWAFKISNKKGEIFAIDYIQVLPVMRHHGHV